MTEATKQTDDSPESAPNAPPDAPSDATTDAPPSALKDAPGDVSGEMSADRPAGAGRRAMLGVELLVLVLLSAWLLWAASVLQVEYFDGYETICNTRYFTGDNYFYQRTRAPVMALALVPAEWCRTQLQLHSLDMRPYHFLMVIFQIVYL